MATKKFAVREMDQLRESPYVLDMTQSIVHFSAQFKVRFYNGLLAGKAPAEIVLEHGIDPEILGVNRVRAGGGGMIDIPANAKYAIIWETSQWTENLEH